MSSMEEEADTTEEARRHRKALSVCHGAWYEPSWASVGAMHEPQNSRDTGNPQHTERNKKIQGVHFWGYTSLNIRRLLSPLGT